MASIPPQDVAVGNGLKTISSTTSSSGSTSSNYNDQYTNQQREQEQQQEQQQEQEQTNALAGNNESLLFVNQTIGNNITTNSNLFTNSSTSNTTLPCSNAAVTEDATTLWLTIAFPVLLVVAFLYCSRGTAPSREYWRGAQIRETARRIRAARRVKKKRQEMTPAERTLQIHDNLWSMTVVGKDPVTGYWKLSSHSNNTKEENPSSSPEESEEPKSQDKHCCHGEGTTNTMPTSTTTTTTTTTTSQTLACCMLTSHNDTKIETKGSHDTADTLEDNDDTDDDPESGKQTAAAAYDGDDDEDVCYICLDAFEKGDVVMWARRRHKNNRHQLCSVQQQKPLPSSNHNLQPNSDQCRHVFHQECLMPWLLEKRENECPSCRAPFIHDDFSSSSSSSSSSTLSENETNDAEHPNGLLLLEEEEGVEVDTDGVILVTNTTLSTINQNETSASAATAATNDVSEDDNINTSNNSNSNNNRNNKNSNPKDDDDEDDCNPFLENDDWMEEGFSFVIAKGLIQRIPKYHYSALAGPVPFRHLPTETTILTTDSSTLNNDNDSSLYYTGQPTTHTNNGVFGKDIVKNSKTCRRHGQRRGCTLEDDEEDIECGLPSTSATSSSMILSPSSAVDIHDGNALSLLSSPSNVNNNEDNDINISSYDNDDVAHVVQVYDGDNGEDLTTASSCNNEIDDIADP